MKLIDLNALKYFYTNLVDVLKGKADVADTNAHFSNKSNPHSVTKSQVGLSKVENKNSQDIRNEITSDNVTKALGYTPFDAVGVQLGGKDLAKDSNNKINIDSYTKAETNNLLTSKADKDDSVMIKAHTDSTIVTEEGNAKIIDWTKNLLTKRTAYSVAGNTSNGFALVNSSSCLAYEVVLKPNTTYTYAKNISVGDKSRIVLSSKPLQIGASIIARQVHNKDDSNKYVITFNTGNDIYAYITLDKGTNSLNVGDCGEILAEGEYTELPYVPAEGYDITVCGRNLANPCSNSWTKTSNSALTVDIDDDDQSMTITYTGTSGNLVPISTSNKSEMIDIRGLVGKTIYCYVDFISGVVSINWIGVRLLHRDANGNTVTVGSSTAVYLSTHDNAIGFYKVGSYEITQSLIDAGVAYIEPGLWISSKNVYTEAKFKLMFALEDGLTAIEKYQGRKTYSVDNDTLPIEIKTLSPVTNILSQGTVTTIIGDNEQGKYFIEMPDKVSFSDLDAILADKVDNSLFVAENLLPCPYYRPNGYTPGGITYTYDEDGIVTVTNTAPATTTGYFAMLTRDQDVCKYGKTYTVSAYSDKEKSEVRLKVAYINIDSGSERGAVLVDVNNKITFEYLPRENEGILVQLYTLKEANPVGEKIKVMLEEGSVAHKYQPYRWKSQVLRDDIDDIAVDVEKCNEDIKMIQTDIDKIVSKPTVESVVSDTNVVTVPYGVQDFAAISMIGGNTVKSKNLVVCPYVDSIFSTPDGRTGIKATVNPDGSIIFDGTATGLINVSLCSVELKAGKTYCMSSFVSQETLNNGSRLTLRTSGFDNYDERESRQTLTPASDRTATLYFRIGDKGTTVNNLLVKPMLVEGVAEDVAVYEPYFSELHSASVNEISITNVIAKPDFSVITKYSEIANRTGYMYEKLKSGKYHVSITNVGTKTAFVGVFRDGTRIESTYNSINLGDSFDIDYDVVDGDDIVIYQGSAVSADFVSNTVVSAGREAYTDTISLVDLIKDLPDYGKGINDTYYNYIDFEEMKYYHKVHELDIGEETVRQNSTRPNIKLIEKYGSLTAATIKTVNNVGISNRLSNETTSIGEVGEGEFRISDYLYYWDDGDATTSAERFAGTKIIIAYKEPEIIDLKPFFSIIPVESNGTIKFMNEYNLPIPNVVKYKKGVE